MNEMTSIFEETSPDTWIDALSDYQKRSIITMREKNYTYQQIAESWITASAAKTAPFSSGAQPTPDKKYLEKLHLEIRAFLCGHEKYDTDRKQLFERNKQLHTFAISSISVAISPYVGSAAVVLVPLVAIILASIGKISLNAWCQTS